MFLTARMRKVPIPAPITASGTCTEAVSFAATVLNACPERLDAGAYHPVGWQAHARFVEEASDCRCGSRAAGISCLPRARLFSLRRFQRRKTFARHPRCQPLPPRALGARYLWLLRFAGPALGGLSAEPWPVALLQYLRHDPRRFFRRVPPGPGRRTHSPAASGPQRETSDLRRIRNLRAGAPVRRRQHRGDCCYRLAAL